MFDGTAKSDLERTAQQWKGWSVEGVLRKAIAYIEQLETQVPKWISVKDRLPEKTHDEDGTLANYIIYMPEYGADIGNYLKPANSWVCMGLPVKVTHWRLLPEPPKEGE